MAITKIIQYPKTVLMNGNLYFGKDNGNGYNYYVKVEDVAEEDVYVHTATLSLGNQVLEFPLFETGFTKTELIPKSWNNEVVNATSRVGTLTIITKKIVSVLLGIYTQVEVNTVNITFQVPNDIKPSITSLTTERIDGKVPSDWGIYVQNHSKCKLTAMAEGVYGSTIKSYKFALRGSLLSLQSSGEYTYPCHETGELYIVVTAIDSRGRSSESKTITITVQPYEKPKINSVLYFRCNEAGEDDDEGTYVLAHVSYTISSVNGKNAAACKVSYAESQTDTWTGDTEIENNSPTVVFGELSADKSYRIKFIVQDCIQDDVLDTSYIGDISTGFVTREYLAGGKGVSLGKAAELEGYFDNAFKALLRKGFELPDTGWQTLTLSSGVTSAGTEPKYQHLGHIVKIRGNVKGIATRGKVIATLPEAARPSSTVNAIGTATGNCITFWSVGTNGNITLLFCLNVATGAESYELNSYDFNINYLI